MAGRSIESWLPGLRLVRTYQRAWLPSDVVAGLSVAAVALPIGIAYAQLAGFPPVVGLYACILPPVAYALFGSSRQLIVNPDAAACAIVAATVAPLAAADATRYGDLSLVLTFLVGLLCIGSGLARLGFVASFLSRPILTGYLNGIALTIIVGQIGALLGFHVASGGFFHTLATVLSRLGETHVATLLTGVGLLAVLLVLKRVAPRLPGPLVAAALGIGAAYLLGLEQHGVAVVGPVPAGFPPPRLPTVGIDDLGPLVVGACSITLVSFCSMMTTARGFAAKNGYAINPNQDFVALGMSDLASAASQGFVVSGADSRTAVADASGGKTQVTGLIAAAAMALVLLFLTGPLAYLPTAALAAVLMSSALGLFDVAALRRYQQVSRPEFRDSLVAMLGTMTVGVLPGVLIAIGLAILKLLSLAAHPRDAVLGVVQGQDGVYGAEAEGADVHTIPGLLIYRFDSAIVFFNADYFQDRVRAQVAAARPAWVLFDAESANLLDMTAAEALDALRAELADQGTTLAIARSKGLFHVMLERTGVAERIGAEYLFPSVHAGAQAFLKARGATPVSGG